MGTLVKEDLYTSGLSFLDQPVENLHLLLETIEGINRSMELKSLLSQSMEATRIVMNSEASSLMLLDEDSHELYVSLPTGPVKEEIEGKSIPPFKGIGGWVVENKRPFISNDVTTTEFFWGELAEDFHTRNIVCVPLINNDNEVIGVLQALNRRRGEDFTPHDIPVFQGLAAHVAAAINRARQVEHLHNRLKEREVMLMEIHHRIKNNLAAINGLIELELPEVEDENAKQVLRNTYSRIQSMTEVHDMLCQKGLFRDVELGMYIKQLTEKVKDTMSDASGKIHLRMDAEHVDVSANKAMLCGLILNELLVNIYKHAFRDREEGNILISLYQDGDVVHLAISDDGVGIGKETTINKNTSIGMWIVDVLLKKLDGELETITEPGSGTKFKVTFTKEI